jgi:beta-1,4-mannosyltransferase
MDGRFFLSRGIRFVLAGYAVPLPPSLRVVQLLGRPDETLNPYTTLLVTALGDLATVDYFDWRRALFGRYEVLHLHWPEMLTRSRLPMDHSGRDTPDSNILRLLLTLLLLLRLSVTRTRLIQTVHNVSPHESGSWSEGFALFLVRQRTHAWIRLNAQSVLPTGAAVYTIAHGHYRDLHREQGARPAVRQAYLFFGLVRAYKGIDELLACFAGTTGGETLRIVGKSMDDRLALRIAEAVRLDRHVSAHLDYLAADDLADEIRASELVVLPYPAMHNSGALLLALSLGRPVLVPAAPVNLEIQREVGADWVITYGSELTPADLMLALAHARSGERKAQPDLSAREWPLIAAETVAAYREARTRSRFARWSGVRS